MPQVTDLHRVYIQTLLSRRLIREDTALELFKRAIRAVKADDEAINVPLDTSKKGFATFLGELGNILENVGLMVKVEKDETKNGKTWVVLINTDANEVGLAGSDFSPTELSYFRGIIADILKSYPANSIGHSRALKLATEQDRKMTKVAAEAVLGALVSRGWLARSKRGRYSLAIRSMLELDPYLKTNFDDLIHPCQRCQKLMMKGLACSGPDCEAHYHFYCFERTKQLHGDSCPRCRVSYETDPPAPIGEDAVRRAEDDFVGGIRNRKRPRSGRKASRNDAEEEEEDEVESEEDQLESQDPSQSQDQTQSQSQSQVEEQSQAPPVNNNRARWATESRPHRKRPSVVPETQYDDEA